jgi:hypothetical protein
MKERRKAVEEKLDAQLNEWNAQIDLLKAKADKAKTEAKIVYYNFYNTIEDLQRRQKDMRAKLHELKTAGDGAWEDIKTGAEKAYGEVNSAFIDAISKLK